MFLTFPSPTHAYNALAALQGHRHKGAQRVVTLDFVQPPVEDVADPLLDDSLSTGSPRGSFESDAMHGLVRTPSSAGVSHMVTPELARQRSLTSVSSVIDDTSSDGFRTQCSPLAETAKTAPHFAYLMSKRVSQWSTEEVCVWLQHYFDFGTCAKDYVRRVRDYTVTGWDLQQLDATDLNELLLAIRVLPHHRRRIVNALHSAHGGYMRPTAAAAAAGVATPRESPTHRRSTSRVSFSSFDADVPMQTVAVPPSLRRVQSSGGVVPPLRVVGRSKSSGVHQDGGGGAHGAMVDLSGYVHATGGEPSPQNSSSKPSKAARKNQKRREKKRLQAQSRGFSRLAAHITGLPVPPAASGAVLPAAPAPGVRVCR